MAKRGQNIVLVSRTLSKLRTVAEELEQKYKVKTKVIDIDFSSERHVQQRVEADTQVWINEVFAIFKFNILEGPQHRLTCEQCWDEL